MSLPHLRRLAKSISIPIPADEDGLVGRECPNADCLGYFKIKMGTGLQGPNLPCHCPYCGHTAGQDHFWTQEQLEYAKSVALRAVQDAISRDVRDWDRSLRQSTRSSFVKMSMDYKGHPQPIRYYREKQLETKAICDNCTLEYAVYGVFAYCPDCGTHNSLQILVKNLELARKELDYSLAAPDAEFAAYLVADALENAVSAFDGFGREVCLINAEVASDASRAKSVSFQNLPKAKTAVADLFGFDLASGLNPDEWAFVCQCFQKRHLLAHRMGVVDQQYVDITGDTSAAVGRKVPIDSDQVRSLLAWLEQIGVFFVAHFHPSSTPQPEA